MEDTRRPYQILVRLAGSAFWHEADINRLKVALPANTRAVVADHAVIVLATMSRHTSDELVRICVEALGKGRFEAVTVVQLGAHSASTDGLLDPFHDWLNFTVRRGARRESDEAEDMFKAKWGQPRRKYSEHRSVMDAIREVFPGARWPRRDRA